MKRLGLVTVGVAMVLLFSQVPAFAWTVGVVDPDPEDVGASLAISLSDHVWVAWNHEGTDDLFWAKWTGSTWQTTQVAGVGTSGCPQYALPSAGFAADGTARIATACTGTVGVIRWTKRDQTTGIWVSQTIAAIPLGSCFSAFVANLSLTFDPVSGLPRIAFADSDTGDVYWLAFDGSSWTMNVVAKGHPECQNSLFVAAAYDPTTGQPAIAWDEQYLKRVMYTSYDAVSGRWRTATVAIGLGGRSTHPALAFTPAGAPWIAFTGPAPNEGSSLMVATNTGDSWTTRVVDAYNKSAGLAPSIAMKGSLPRIASFDYTKGDLRFAAYSGTAWTLSTLDTSGSTGHDPSLGFTTVGDPYIAYRFFISVSDAGIKWARPSG